ncbi:hypothetical protein [Halospeciosus flavus]|uniref:Uncharacterized protein n=1 Tax=Halospeciosus flavus TaxID=3032283 RepID=A0ABD5Z831_9EURY|nr:hypothetical protein [Halospeciosus flavus]
MRPLRRLSVDAAEALLVAVVLTLTPLAGLFVAGVDALQPVVFLLFAAVVALAALVVGRGVTSVTRSLWSEAELTPRLLVVGSAHAVEMVAATVFLVALGTLVWLRAAFGVLARGGEGAVLGLLGTVALAGIVLVGSVGGRHLLVWR